MMSIRITLMSNLPTVFAITIFLNEIAYQRKSKIWSAHTLRIFRKVTKLSSLLLAAFKFLWKSICDEVKNYTEVDGSKYFCMAKELHGSNLIQYRATEMKNFELFCLSFGL